VNPKVLGLDVFINCSEPSCSPLSEWSEHGSHDAEVIFHWVLYELGDRRTLDNGT